MVLAILMASTVLLLLILIINGAAILMAKHSIVMLILIIILLPLYFGAYSSHSFCHRAMNEVSNVRPNRESCAMTFISDRGTMFAPGQIGQNQTH